jgi:hypothetical protein
MFLFILNVMYEVELYTIALDALYFKWIAFFLLFISGRRPWLSVGQAMCAAHYRGPSPELLVSRSYCIS